MIIVKAASVKGVSTPPPYERTLKLLLSPAVHDVNVGMSMGLVTFQPGKCSAPHEHSTEQETWYVISGKGTFRVGDEEAEVEADAVVVSPPRLVHQIVNTGDKELRVLWVFTPAGPETQWLVSDTP